MNIIISELWMKDQASYYKRNVLFWPNVLEEILNHPADIFGWYDGQTTEYYTKASLINLLSYRRSFWKQPTKNSNTGWHQFNKADLIKTCLCLNI